MSAPVSAVRYLGFYTIIPPSTLVVPCIISAPPSMPTTVVVHISGEICRATILHPSALATLAPQLSATLMHTLTDPTITASLVHVLQTSIPSQAFSEQEATWLLTKLTSTCTQVSVSLLPANALSRHQSYRVSYPTSVVSQQVTRARLNSTSTSSRSDARRTDKISSMDSSRLPASKAMPYHATIPAEPPTSATGPQRSLLSILPSDNPLRSSNGVKLAPTVHVFGCFQHTPLNNLAIPITATNPTARSFNMSVACNGVTAEYSVHSLANDDQLQMLGLDADEARSVCVLVVTTADRYVDVDGHVRVVLHLLDELSDEQALSYDCGVLHWSRSACIWRYATPTGLPSSRNASSANLPLPVEPPVNAFVQSSVKVTMPSVASAPNHRVTEIVPITAPSSATALSLSTSEDMTCDSSSIVITASSTLDSVVSQPLIEPEQATQPYEDYADITTTPPGIDCYPYYYPSITSTQSYPAAPRDRSSPPYQQYNDSPPFTVDPAQTYGVSNDQQASTNSGQDGSNITTGNNPVGSSPPASYSPLTPTSASRSTHSPAPLSTLSPAPITPSELVTAPSEAEDLSTPVPAAVTPSQPVTPSPSPRISLSKNAEVPKLPKSGPVRRQPNVPPRPRPYPLRSRAQGGVEEVKS
ncbi:hypothetical protein BKA62DRAFT_710042 [Auriculariales sp. MPI-PUGE-AT-0066]|nr:hypothetical protein BKA62DRAFT_710042 [Auriculariales sp. MPI-PUGE-AT-0066]